MRKTLARTRVAVTAAVTRSAARRVFAGVAALYLGAYLFAIGHLRPGRGGVDVFVVADPFSRALQPVGPLSYEAVAVIEAGPVTLLVAPVNLLLGTGLAALVGLNLAVWYLAWTQPTACGLGHSAGAVAGLPALLSGAACCGPVLLIALGIQATGLLLAAFGVLVPAAALLLVGSLLFVGRHVDPTRLDDGQSDDV